MIFCSIIVENYTKLFVITVNFQKVVRYNHEDLLIKHAEPNQTTYFVRYNRVFVITVIVITEFDCTLIKFHYFLFSRVPQGPVLILM